LLRKPIVSYPMLGVMGHDGRNCTVVADSAPTTVRGVFAPFPSGDQRDSSSPIFFKSDWRS
jgi:hypothetical protein